MDFRILHFFKLLGRIYPRIVVALIFINITGCGGGGTSSSPTGPPTPPTPPTLQNITVASDNPSAELGTILQFTATGNHSDGSTQILAGTVQWSSANTAVAIVDNTGIVQRKEPKD
jgi:hypothetical protein